MTVISNKPDFNVWFELKTHFEGFYPLAYKDSGGVWTLGFGSTYNHKEKRKVQAGDTISRREAIEFMQIDAATVIREINQYITVPLNPMQMTAICDYVYNRGIKNMLRTNIDELINSKASAELICKEIIGTGLRDRLGNLLWGLGRRRRAQAWLFFKGQLKLEWNRWEKVIFK